MSKNQKKTKKFQVKTTKPIVEEVHFAPENNEEITTWPVLPKPPTLEERLENNPEIAKSLLLAEIKRFEDNYQIYLPQGEREILFGYIEDSSPDLVYRYRYCIGFLRATRFGFYPNELQNLLEAGGENITFVLGVIEFTWGQSDISLDYLNRVIYTALNNRTKIPRKVFLTSLQLAQICLLDLNRGYHLKAEVEMADLFLKNIRSIEALRKICEESFIPDSSYDEIDIADSFIILPNIEFTEDEIEKAETSMKSSISLIMVDLLKANERHVMEHIDSATGQIINQVHLETPASVRLKLINEYGPWIKNLLNQGALANAEFLYEKLGSQSWGEVIDGYWDVVENELQNKIIKSIRNYLFKVQHNYSLSLTVGYSITVNERMELEDIQKILKDMRDNPILHDFIANYAPEKNDFLCRELLPKIQRLWVLRKPSAHGVVISERDAAEAKNMFLGTPEKPGILKKLAELPKVF